MKIPLTVKIESEHAEVSNCAEREPYALMVLGDSMLPEFEDGEIIIIEPVLDLMHDGSFVIAEHDGELIFRQVLFREDGLYLNPLNDAYPMQKLARKEDVKGVITQKKRPGKRHIHKNYD
ncbi:MAG: S24 family peptidase [Sulfuricellaceae bacterium]|nr:S24 family peptidase [Sulfuricellaceae bacterium]